MNNKLCVLIAVACLGTSLYGSFPRDIQRDLLGADPVARKAAAQRALKMRLPALKLMTFTGMSAAQLQQIVNAPTAAAPAAQSRVRPAPEARRVRPEGGLGMRPPVRPVERPEGVRPGLPRVEKPALLEEAKKGELMFAEEGEEAPAPKKGEKPRKAGEARAQNPVAEFPDLVAMNLTDISPDEIRKAAYTDMIKGRKAEDIFRMMLGLQPGFTRNDKDKAARRLLFKWHPDRADVVDKAYAQEVYGLINAANDALEKREEDREARK